MMTLLKNFGDRESFVVYLFIFSKIISAKDKNSAIRLNNSLHEQETSIKISQPVSDMNKIEKSRLSMDDVNNEHYRAPFEFATLCI